MSQISSGLQTISHEEYHRSRAIGSTMLKAAEKSLAHYRAHINGELEVSESQRSRFDLGTCMHEAILEQKIERYICGPEVSSKAVKEWKEFVKANEPMIVLTPDEYRKTKGAFDKFYSHPIASALRENALIEQSMFWECRETGLLCKARPDIIGTDHNGDVYLVDYKTTRDARPRSFEKSIVNYGYDLSAAHYLAGYEQVMGVRPKNFFFISQEIEAPYELMVYAARPEMLARAERRRLSLLNQIKQAYQTQEFFGYEPRVRFIDVPYWAVGEEE
jgi:PDDEXK-like domain of unknown function (DUF3799)